MFIFVLVVYVHAPSDTVFYHLAITLACYIPGVSWTILHITPFVGYALFCFHTRCLRARTILQDTLSANHFVRR